MLIVNNCIVCIVCIYFYLFCSRTKFLRVCAKFQQEIKKEEEERERRK